MILNSILITLLFYIIYFFTKTKLKSTLGIWYYRTIVMSYFVLILFFVVFIIFFRFLKIFQDSKSLDLNLIYYQYNLITLFLFFTIFIVLRKTFFHYTKICYFRLHYVWLSPVMTPKFYKYYTWFYLNIIYFFSKKYYNLIWYLNLSLNLSLILFLFLDIILNNCILFYFIIYLKYIGLLKLFLIWSIFISTHLDIEKDFYVFSSLYAGDKTKNSFYTDPKYEIIRRNEIEVINDYIVKTFYGVSPDYKKMIKNWNKEKKQKNIK